MYKCSVKKQTPVHFARYLNMFDDTFYPVQFEAEKAVSSLVYCHAYIVGFRAILMFQDKVQPAGNGLSIARTF